MKTCCISLNTQCCRLKTNKFKTKKSQAKKRKKTLPMISDLNFQRSLNFRIKCKTDASKLNYSDLFSKSYKV